MNAAKGRADNAVSELEAKVAALKAAAQQVQKDL
jgi:hypothetical protein